MDFKTGSLCKYKCKYKSKYTGNSVIMRIHSFYKDEDYVSGLTLHSNSSLYKVGYILGYHIDVLCEVNADDLKKLDNV